jgi:hypothetical protein
MQLFSGRVQNAASAYGTHAGLGLATALRLAQIHTHLHPAPFDVDDLILPSHLNPDIKLNQRRPLF